MNNSDGGGKGDSGDGGKGYRKPPKEHQWPKGKSGNPGGRPKGSKNKKSLLSPDAPLLGSDEPTRNLILQESYRSVRVRDGSNIIEMPVNQAILRAMQQKALKGSRLAQRDLTLLVRQVEADQRAEQFDAFKGMVEYKLGGEEEIARCKALGKDPPEMLPHPDDIEIDPRKGTFAIRGPMTPEEMADQDNILEHREEMQKTINDTAKRYRRAKSEERKAALRDIWHHLQKNFDMINDLVGPRYRRTLENRSFEQGATQPGEIAMEHGISE